MNKYDFVSVDFETAQPPQFKERFICQVGIVAVKDGKIVEKYNTLIKPRDNDYEPSVIPIHGITPKDTADRPTFDVIWNEIEHFFVGNKLVAHTAHGFDEPVLRFNLEYYGIMPFGINRFIDTTKLFNASSNSLESLCFGFNIPCENHHDALFDAECCARFYMNYLNEIYPDYSAIDKFKKTKKSNKNFNFYATDKHQPISGELLVKDLSNADPSNPFYDKKVVITGEFSNDRRVIAKRIKDMGGDINTTISRNTNFVIIGTNPGPAKIEKIESLVHNGYTIKTLSESQVNKIFSGESLDNTLVTSTKKNISITTSHIFNNKIAINKDTLNLFAGDKLLLYQLFGYLEASGDEFIDADTSACLLSDSTIAKLESGEKDKTIMAIENNYNQSDSIAFNYKFITESEFLDYCKSRIDRVNDDVSLYYYEKYMEEAIKAIEAKSIYEFKDGKNYCKVKGKLILKLEGGRTWCPSRQMRGSNYSFNEEKEQE